MKLPFALTQINGNEIINYLNQKLSNDVLILKQKMPFDETYDHGHQNRTWITDIYLLNGNIHQKRQAKAGGAWWRSSNPKENNGKLREVKYPISKKLLEQFNIPKDTKITLQNG